MLRIGDDPPGVTVGVPEQPARALLRRSWRWLVDTAVLLAVLVAVCVADPHPFRRHGLPELPANRRLTDVIERLHEGRVLETVPRHHRHYGVTPTQTRLYRARWSR